MEKENRGFFNSPVIQRNTPIKRLGLSRKRKNCGTESSPLAKIPACNEKLISSPSHLEKVASDKEIPSDTNDCENEDNTSPENYVEEIEKLKEEIKEKEEKLKTLQYNKNNIEQLEDLIELWKSGCKNAFFHFNQLLKDRESENIDIKTVLNKLGVWETIFEHFQDDPDICF